MRLYSKKQEDFHITCILGFRGEIQVRKSYTMPSGRGKEEGFRGCTKKELHLVCINLMLMVSKA